jgi:hypothetical protein
MSTAGTVIYWYIHECLLPHLQGCTEVKASMATGLRLLLVWQNFSSHTATAALDGACGAQHRVTHARAEVREHASTRRPLLQRAAQEPRLPPTGNHHLLAAGRVAGLRLLFFCKDDSGAHKTHLSGVERAFCKAGVRDSRRDTPVALEVQGGARAAHDFVGEVEGLLAGIGVHACGSADEDVATNAKYGEEAINGSAEDVEANEVENGKEATNETRRWGGVECGGAGGSSASGRGG